MNEIANLCTCPRCRYFREYLGDPVHDESSYRCSDCVMVRIHSIAREHDRGLVRLAAAFIIVSIFIVSLCHAWPL